MPKGIAFNSNSIPRQVVETSLCQGPNIKGLDRIGYEAVEVDRDPHQTSELFKGQIVDSPRILKPGDVIDIISSARIDRGQSWVVSSGLFEVLNVDVATSVIRVRKKAGAKPTLNRIKLGVESEHGAVYCTLHPLFEYLYTRAL